MISFEKDICQIWQKEVRIVPKLSDIGSFYKTNPSKPCFRLGWNDLRAKTLLRQIKTTQMPGQICQLPPSIFWENPPCFYQKQFFDLIDQKTIRISSIEENFMGISRNLRSIDFLIERKKHTFKTCLKKLPPTFAHFSNSNKGKTKFINFIISTGFSLPFNKSFIKIFSIW